jgi:uncharacterized protein (DUF111 family)
MKKGRPAHTVHVLCDPADDADLRRLLAELTGTLGVRVTAVGRWAAERREVVVEVHGLPVRMKEGPVRAKPEFDDVTRVAARTGQPLAEVVEAALAAWRAVRRERVDGDGGRSS